MGGAGRKRLGPFGSGREPHPSLFTEERFRAAVDFEEARSARSGKPCLLMLLGIAGFGQTDKHRFVRALTGTLFSQTRETDLKGWWRTDSQIGILFTEIDVLNPDALREAQRTIKRKILTALQARFGEMATERVAISWSVFPKPLLETREA